LLKANILHGIVLISFECSNISFLSKVALTFHQDLELKMGELDRCIE